MTTDFKAAMAATQPYQRRRETLAQEHAARTAAAQATPLEPPRHIPPFIADPLRKCVCGARPRYGFEEHVRFCAKAIEAAKSVALIEAVEREIAEPPPVTAVKIGAKGDCPKCGRHFAKGLHLHARACKG